MTDEEYQNYNRLARRCLEKELTPEIALMELVRAGILDWDGNFRSHYPALREYQERMKIHNLK